MGDPLTIGRILAILGARPYGNGRSGDAADELQQQLQKGQVLVARVAKILGNGNIILEIAGRNMSPSEGAAGELQQQLQKGQVIVAQVARALANGNVVLEIAGRNATLSESAAGELRQQLQTGRQLIAQVAKILDNGNITLEIAGRNASPSEGAAGELQQQLQKGQVLVARVAKILGTGNIILEIAGRNTSPSEGAAGELRQQLQTGQILLAQVAKVLGNGNIVLEIAGKNYETASAPQIQQGQALTIRLSELQPALQQEFMQAQIQEDRHLAEALRTLFSGDKGLAALTLRLSEIVQVLKALPGQPIPRELLQQIIEKLQPIEVRPASQGLGDLLRQFLSGRGLDFEPQLRSAVEDGKPVNISGLKQLLVKLEGILQGFIARETGDRAGAPTDALRESLGKSGAEKGTPSRLPSGTLHRALDDLAREFHSRILQRIPSLMRTEVGGLLRKFVTTLQRLDLEGNFQKAAEQLTNSSREFRLSTGESFQLLPHDQASAVERATLDLIERVEQVIAREILVRGGVEEISRAVVEMRAHIEGEQVLNSQLGDRQLHQHLFVPVMILNELTDVQIKQFLSSRGKSGKERGSLTVVVLLNLESLGRLRIDALLQEKTLYCSVAVENPEAARLVEGLAGEFAAQVESRGFRLGKLVCRVDSARIDNFQHIGEEILGDDEALIDVRI